MHSIFARHLFGFVHGRSWCRFPAGVWSITSVARADVMTKQLGPSSADSKDRQEGHIEV